MKSTSAIAWRWLIFLGLILAFIAPSIWSQRLERREVNAHLRRAYEEVVGRRGRHDATFERVREAFSLRDGTWDKAQAKVSLAEAIRRKRFSLTRDGNGFQVLLEPSEDLTPERVDRTSSDFVDSISSVIRRLSILEEIRPARPRENLNHDQLRDYLRDRMNLIDYSTVADSFHPALMTDVVTFETPTTLLRIYGGESNAIGRYFFCCLHSVLDIFSGPRFWSDASGLATPPENLLDHLAVATIPAGTTAIIGTVADNFPGQNGRLATGGNTQIFIPNVKTFPFQEYRFTYQYTFQFPRSETIARGGNVVSEIALESDDRILWFRR